MTLLSDNAEAAYGLQINVQSPTDKYLDPDTTPQSILFTIEVTNTGTSEENVNVTITFDDGSKPAAGWTVNPDDFTVNNLGSGVTETRQITITAPNDNPYPDFAQLTVDGFVQESPITTSSDSFIARVSPIYDVKIQIKDNDNAKNANQSGQVTYLLIINNTGNAQDTISLAASGLPPGWVASFTPDSEDVSRDSSFTSTLSLSIPDLAKSTVYPISIIATSEGDPSETDSTSTFTTINPEYQLSLSVSDNSVAGLPGSDVEYILTVDNLGNTNDDVTPTILKQGGLTWTAFTDKNIQTIPFNSSKSWTLTVSIPSDARNWETGTIIFNVTSEDPTGYDQMITITKVLPTYGVNVFLPINQKTADPGDTISYEVEITNEGNTNDTIRIYPSGPFTSVIAPNKLFTLPPDTPTIVTLNVTLPDDALSGFHDILVIGESEGDPMGITGNDTARVDVNPFYDIDLQSSGGSYKSGEPDGPSVSYILKIFNEGTDEDEIDLSKGGQKPNWASLSETAVTIPAKSNVIVYVNVSIPGAEPISVWYINITGTSVGNSSRIDTQAFQIEVEQTFDVTLSSSDNSQSVPAGGQTTYYINVKNTGSGMDDFSLNPWSLNDLARTWASVVPANVKLNSNQNTTVQMIIDVPAGAIPGTYDIQLNCTSDNDTDAKLAYITITEVTDRYEVVIAGADERSLEAPEDINVTYVLEVYNFGTGNDTFEVSVSGDRTGWVTLGTNLIQNLPSGGQYNLTVTVKIEDSNDPAIGDGQHNIQLLITSRDDPTIPPSEDSVWLNTSLTATRDASLNPIQDVYDALPGEIVNFTVVVTNTGSETDTFELEDEGVKKGWGIILPPTIILAADESINITYQVDISEDVTRAESPVEFFLLAKSLSNDEYVENITLTINIEKTYGVKILSTNNELTGDPGEIMVFEIEIINQGNDEDDIILKHSGPETGEWEKNRVPLLPDASIFVNYTVEIDPDHDTQDIIILLNATSDGDSDTYMVLQITIHVEPRYEVRLSHNGGDRKDGLAGQTTQYNLTVKNEGTDIDSFDITVESPGGFQVTVSTVTIQVESVVNDPVNSTQVVFVWVTPRADPPIEVGEYYINITATSVNDNTAIDIFTFIVDVKATRAVKLFSPTASTQVEAGDPAVFAGIQVTNEGNDDDSFSFYHIGLPPGWTTSPLSNQNNIPPDATGSFDFTVYTTQESASGIYNLTLVARSINDPTKESAVLLTIEVLQIYEIEIPSVSGKSVDIGNSVTYLIEVRNKGNGDDEIELKLTQDADTWTWLFYSPTENGTTIHVSPPSGGSVTVTLYVSPPSDYWDNGDGSLLLRVEAKSLDDPAGNPATYDIDVITTINAEYGIEIFSAPITSEEPGQSVSYLFDVKNTGTTIDSYSIRVDDVDGPPGADESLWIPQISFSPSTISGLNDGQTTPVQMFVNIPDPSNLYLVPPGRYNITVEMTSTNDQDAKDTQIFGLDVLQVYVAEIQDTVDPQDVNVGEMIQYTITITNKGNSDDLFSVRLQGDDTIPGSVDWARLSHSGTDQWGKQSLTNIPLASSGTGASDEILLNITIPTRDDPDYPSVDPDDITITVIVKPSDPFGDEDFVDVTADINVIYEFDFIFLAEKLDVNPGDEANFQITIENQGTSSETFIYEIYQWKDKNWSPYGYSFSPTQSQIGAKSSDDVTLRINTPPDLKDAESKDYNITIRVHSQAGDIDILKDCVVHIEPVYDVQLTTTDQTGKSVSVGNDVTYQFSVRNTGNSLETFQFTISDMDPSSDGDQSSWAKLYLVSDQQSPVSSVDLETDESQAMILIISVPDQGDPDFEEIQGSLDIRIESIPSQDPDVRDDLTTYTTLDPIYTFLLQSTVPLDTKEGEPGEIVEFTLQVQNTGTRQDTYDFRITSVDESVFTYTTPNSISDLGVDEYGTTKAAFTLTTALEQALMGSYQIEVTVTSKADAGVSNIIILTVEITALGEVEITPETQSDTGEPEESVDYTIRVSNKGNAQDTFDLSLSGNYKDWGDIINGDGISITKITLNATTLPGSYADLTLRVSIPGTGETTADQTYPITIKASSTNTEGKEDQGQVSTKVEEYVDLILEYSGSGQPVRDYDPNGKSPKFSLRVTNNGNQPEDALEVIIDVDPDWDYSPKIMSQSLEPGGGTTFSIEFTIPSDESEDEYPLQVKIKSSADPSYESDPVFITINITKPDLSVSSGDITGLDDLDYLKGRVGNAVTISAEIHNEGHSKAESVQIKLFEDNNVRGTKTISSIDPDSSRKVDFRWTVVAEEVEIKVEVTEQYEIDDGNNVISPIFLDLRGDLEFEGDLNFSVAEPDPGEKITIRAFISNSGGDAEDVVVNFFHGTKKIGSDTIDVDAGDTEEASIEWEVPDSSGESVTIKAEMDADNAILPGDKESSFKTGGDVGVGEVFSGAGMLSMIIGLVIGAILFLIIGMAIGKRAGGGRAEGTGMAAGPSFAAFEKEMAEGADKKAMKGPAMGPAPGMAPAPFERMDEGGAPPEEEEPGAKPKEVARVRCPKCGKVTEVTSTQRPLQIPCECGTTLMLKK